MIDRSTQLPRLASADDIPELIRLRAVMFDSMGVDSDQTDWRSVATCALAERFAAGTLIAVVIDSSDHDAELIASGMASINRQLPGPRNPTGYEARISSISTERDHRRRGLASAVLDRLISELDARGISRVELHATDDGRSLYESRGFRPRPGGVEMRLMQ